MFSLIWVSNYLSVYWFSDLYIRSVCVSFAHSTCCIGVLTQTVSTIDSIEFCERMQTSKQDSKASSAMCPF